MSIHPSLKFKERKLRSVLKRHERLAKAIREEKWRKGMSVYGLPKFNPTKFKIVKKKEDEKSPTVMDEVNLLEQHQLAKQQKAKDKKQKLTKKETMGRK